MALSKQAALDSLPPEWPDDLQPAIRRAIALSQRTLVVLDDDPTGTQTVHDLPVLTHWSVDALRDELARGTETFYLLTNSRSLPATEAQRLKPDDRGELARGVAAREARDCGRQSQRLDAARAFPCARSRRSPRALETDVRRLADHPVLL